MIQKGLTIVYFIEIDDKENLFVGNSWTYYEMWRTGKDELGKALLSDNKGPFFKVSWEEHG